MSGYYLELLTATTYNVKNSEGAIVNDAPLPKLEAYEVLEGLNNTKPAPEPKKMASKPKKAKKEEKNDKQEERDMDD